MLAAGMSLSALGSGYHKVGQIQAISMSKAARSDKQGLPRIDTSDYYGDDESDKSLLSSKAHNGEFHISSLQNLC